MMNRIDYMENPSFSKNAQSKDIFSNLFDKNGKMRIIDGMRYYKKTDEQNNMPRFVVYMDEDIDADCLKRAVQTALDRHRVFRLIVIQDEKRFYLMTNHSDGVIHPDDGSRPEAGGEKNNGLLTYISYRDNKINVDFFHGISDGIGLLAFIRTLLGCYCSERYEGVISTVDTKEDPREYADSLLFVPETPVSSGIKYEYQQAFQLPERQMDEKCSCKHYKLSVETEAFERFMHENGASRSTAFAWMMNRTIAQIHPEATDPIVAALAVNARKAFGAELTQRCCVASVPIWYDKELALLPTPEQLAKTRQMLVDGTKTETLIASAQRLKKFNETMEERFEFLEEKQAFARSVNKQGSIKYTYGISYLGEPEYGNGIDRHVKESSLILCANTSPLILEIAKCGDHYVINYCSHISDDPYVFQFRDAFISAGIPCLCEQQEDFVEASAVFTKKK